MHDAISVTKADPIFGEITAEAQLSFIACLPADIFAMTARETTFNVSEPTHEIQIESLALVRAHHKKFVEKLARIFEQQVCANQLIVRPIKGKNSATLSTF